jgi:hypothetical protein
MRLAEKGVRLRARIVPTSSLVLAGKEVDANDTMAGNAGKRS